MEKALPAIPAKRYFTIGEVSELCGVKPYVLRYWEQEFAQLKPMKRRGNRRYYQHHEVLLVRRIRELLYDQGFTISGARNRLADAAATARTASGPLAAAALAAPAATAAAASAGASTHATASVAVPLPAAASRHDASGAEAAALDVQRIRTELLSIRDLLGQ